MCTENKEINDSLEISTSECSESFLEPYNYISRILSEKTLMKTIMVFNHWLEVPKDKLDIISEIVEMLNRASLIIDDIEDDAKIRKGSPATHSIFGVGQSINTANYIYFLALEKLITLGKIEESLKVFTENILETHRGQGMDLYWRESFICPTEDEYKSMAIKKSGCVFNFILQLMQIFSLNKSDFKPLMNIFGIYIQIINDYENFTSEEFNNSESFCEDITEGKFSFLIIHAIQADPSDTKVLNILKQRTSDKDVKSYCVEYMKKVGSFDYTRNVLCQMETEIQQEIKKLGGNPFLTDVIRELGKIYR